MGMTADELQNDIRAIMAEGKARRARLKALQPNGYQGPVSEKTNPEPNLGKRKPSPTEISLKWIKERGKKISDGIPSNVIPFRRIEIEDIEYAVCVAYRTCLIDIRSENRMPEIVHVRWIAMYLARKLTKLSLTEIGKSLGRDHSSVMNGVRKITQMIEADPDFKAEIESLEGTIRGQ